MRFIRNFHGIGRRFMTTTTTNQTKIDTEKLAEKVLHYGILAPGFICGGIGFSIGYLQGYAGTNNDPLFHNFMIAYGQGVLYGFGGFITGILWPLSIPTLGMRIYKDGFKLKFF